MQNIDLIPLASYVFVTTFTPGPNNITCTSMAVLYGLRQALRFIYGIISGFFIMMLVCGSLSHILLKTIPDIEPILRWVGAVYILWLAYIILRASYSFKVDKEVKPLGFTAAFFLQFVNPKAAIYGLTIYSVFLAPLTSNSLYVALSAGIFAVVTFSATFTWALFGTTLKKFLYNQRLKNLINLVLVLLLIYTAATLAGIL